MDSSEQDARKADKEAFAHIMIDAVREAGETAELSYDADAFSLRAAGERSNVFYLANAYAEHTAAAPEGRPAVLRRFVRTWFSSRTKEVPEEFDDARPDLLPGVRGRALFELTPLRLRSETDAVAAWPYRVLAGHLGVGLVYDRPEMMTQVLGKVLDGWGVSFDDALAVACDNLRQMSGQDFVQPVPGVWLSPWRDNYDASRLVLPELLMRFEVEGDLVAAAPNRDVLVLTGSEDAAGLAFLCSLVEEQMEKPRPLSALAVRLDGTTWLPFLPDPDSPLYERFKLLQVRSAMQDHDEQAECLNALHERTGEDVFVAGYKAVRKEGGRVISWCVWSEGVDTLLPRTDEVFFFRPAGEGEGKVVARGRWARVREVAGELMEPCGLYPERLRVRSFPTDEQLAAIGGSEEDGAGS
jgi:hypothetical protein